MSKVGLGFNVHTGWAAVVAVMKKRDALEVIAKERIDMAFTFEEGAVFHMAESLSVSKARVLIDSREKKFEALAVTALAAIIDRLEVEVAGSAVVDGAAKKLPPLESVLKSHALIHTAEGDLYRRIIVRACDACEVPAIAVGSKELGARAAHALRVTEEELAARMAAAGKASGRPWAADQKRAAMAAICVRV